MLLSSSVSVITSSLIYLYLLLYHSFYISHFLITTPLLLPLFLVFSFLPTFPFLITDFLCALLIPSLSPLPLFLLLPTSQPLLVPFHVSSSLYPSSSYLCKPIFFVIFQCLSFFSHPCFLCPSISPSLRHNLTFFLS